MSEFWILTLTFEHTAAMSKWRYTWTKVFPLESFPQPFPLRLLQLFMLLADHGSLL